MTARKPKTPTHAAYANKPVTALMEEYAEWLTAETGYTVDARSVYLASALRTTFQKSEHNQTRIANEATAREQAKQERAARAKQRAASAKERAAKKAEREQKQIERARAILAAAETKSQELAA